MVLDRASDDWQFITRILMKLAFVLVKDCSPFSIDHFPDSNFPLKACFRYHAEVTEKSAVAPNPQPQVSKYEFMKALTSLFSQPLRRHPRPRRDLDRAWPGGCED